MTTFVKPSCLAMLAITALVGGPASAAVTITQQAGPAPTYSSTLNFDEAGGPVGPNVPNNAWGSIGITTMMSGSGVNNVGNMSGTYPWLPNNNAYFAPFGALVRFASDVTSISFQAWDPSGPPSPFGGGMLIVLLNDGNESSPVHVQSFTPAWGGVGNSWFNITISGTLVDEIRIAPNGFPNETYVDNISWAAVPAPGAMAILLLAGLNSNRRRRS